MSGAAADGSRSAPMSGAAGDGSRRAPGGQREEILGPFLSEHWRLPVPAQGPVPDGWSEAEASLDPAACAACHPAQYADWKTSLHARAWSPGFAGQLRDGPLAQPAEFGACLTCHAPLSEQLSDGALRSQGVVCASCHVRRHRRLGPPRRADAEPTAEPAPHGGFEARDEFRESRFCAECHQFFDETGPGGKPIQNTFLEWRASPQAAAGETCQSCHMPGRRHLWRGIHDPETVREAVDVELEPGGGDLLAALVVSNRGVGHRFPTYLTPRVHLEIWQEDASGGVVDGTRVRGEIARILDWSDGSELSDTRIPPGGSARLEYRRPRAPGAVGLAARVTVDPDHHYRAVFDELRGIYSDPEARRLMEEAFAQASRSSYVLGELRLPLAGDGEGGG